MFTSASTITWLVVFSIAFTALGIVFSRTNQRSLEDYVTARNSQSAVGTTLTLLATSLGAWILFAPAQAATWGGIAAVTGYALGAMSPRLIMIPLGRRMREVAPSGHTLTEFVSIRFGRPMYLLTLLIMMFFMFIALTAEITAVAKLVTLLAPVPLWITAAIVMISTLLYTAWGGLRASIFTDKIQMAVIAPLLLILLAFGWQAVGGYEPVLQGLEHHAPHLLDPFNATGVKAGLTFFVAILLTGLFHQGNWQRVYSARDNRTLRNGFLIGGLLAAPCIFVMGLFGLAFVGLRPAGDSSVALFSVLMPAIPHWFAIALIPLALALVMSTADTAISAVSSIIATDVRRLSPGIDKARLMQLARWLIVLMCIPVVVAAAQGYSVLYLFLLADLFCAAAAFPVFYGLFSRRHDGTTAVTATLAGLVAGFVLFPAPGAKMDYLLESFLLAALAPVAVTWLMRRVRKNTHTFNLDDLNHQVRNLDA